MKEPRSLAYTFLNLLWHIVYVFLHCVHTIFKIAFRVMYVYLYLAFHWICFGPAKNDDDDSKR